MENPVKMDDLGGKPTIFGNTHILLPIFFWGGGKQKPDAQKAHGLPPKGPKRHGLPMAPSHPARPSADASGEPAGQVLSALPTQTKSEVTWSEQKPGCLGYTWMSQEVTKCKWLL